MNSDKMVSAPLKDAHTEHCCSTHGCKYGDEDCTVTTGKAPQSFLCESCDDDLREACFEVGRSGEPGDVIREMNDELVDLRAKLTDLVSAVRSINFGPRHAISRGEDDEPWYPQRKEWVEWILELCDSALSAEAVEPVCCTPTALEAALLADGDYTPEELWGASKPSCPKCHKTDRYRKDSSL